MGGKIEKSFLALLCACRCNQAQLLSTRHTKSGRRSVGVGRIPSDNKSVSKRPASEGEGGARREG